MYQTFKISNFRGFKELTIDGLKRVNLITGQNNSGKTSLLEALFLHSGKSNPALSININAFRGMDVSFFSNSPFSQSAPWDSIFYRFDTSKSIELTATIEENGSSITQQLYLSVKPLSELNSQIQQIMKNPEVPQLGFPVVGGTFANGLELKDIENGGKPRIYHLTLRNMAEGIQINIAPPPQAPPFLGVLLSGRARPGLEQDATRFSKLEVVNGEQILLNALRIMEKKLKRLVIVAETGTPLIYADLGLDRLLPLYVVGEGMSWLASIILTISDFKNGVVFIDEIECGIHYSVLESLWRAIYESAVHYNVQIFATTHSLECIQAAHRVFQNEPNYDFQLYRLDKLQDGSTRAVEYDRETLDAAIAVDVEVR